MRQLAMWIGTPGVWSCESTYSRPKQQRLVWITRDEAQAAGDFTKPVYLSLEHGFWWIDRMPLFSTPNPRDIARVWAHPASSEE